MDNDEEYPGQIKVSKPLLSRLNRLDSLMKHLGEKKNLWGKKSSQDDNSKGRLDGKCMPLNVAIEEVCSKGSLLDRIASLEDRLLQICLEIESYRRSCSSSTNTSSGASSASNNGSKSERISSYPTFGNKLNPQCKKQPQLPFNRSQVETEAPQPQQKLKLCSSMREQPKLQEKTKDKKTGRKGKKNIVPNWPRLKILGC
ncbi:hypothetical protein ACH5RR_040516 [Cinchona calisaya]|uniref:Uncharacterized protein n=1 Tax=Cinchona calisaya TaxID=153742 RepID=A0ABD2XU98_9GENT